MRHDIFISYSRRDLNEVRDLIAYLQNQIPELKCWFDVTGIESASEFEDKIISAITESSYILFALSDNSMNSTWTKDEVTYAKNIGKTVIPVLLKGATLKQGWFLFKFGRIDCIDSTDELQMQKLVRNLSEWTQKPMATVTETYQYSQTSQYLVVNKPKKIDKVMQSIKNNEHILYLKYFFIDDLKDYWFSNLFGVSLCGFVYYKLISAALKTNMHICLFIIMCISMIASIFCYVSFFRKSCILSILLITLIFYLGTGLFNLYLAIGIVIMMFVLYFAKT